MKDTERHVKELFETVATIKDAKQAELFLDDLCTKKEIAAMAQRLAAARLLMQGCTYEQIIEKTDISSATLSRVSKCVKNGGGYITVK